jgi:hypothetical protein
MIENVSVILRISVFFSSCSDFWLMPSLENILLRLDMVTVYSQRLSKMMEETACNES